MSSQANAAPYDTLQRRFEDPKTQQSLATILDHLELIALGVTAADGLFQRAETISESVVDSVKEVRKGVDSPATMQVAKRLPQALENLPALLDLLERAGPLLQSPGLKRLLDLLSDPSKLEALASILDKIELVSFFLTGADQMFRRSEVIIASVSDSVAQVKDSVVDGVAQAKKAFSHKSYAHLIELYTSFNQLLPTLQLLLPKVKTLLESKEFRSLLSSGALEPQTIRLVTRAGDALVESYRDLGPNSENLGVVGVLKTSRDPDVMRAVTFLAEFGRRFGRELQKPHA